MSETTGNVPDTTAPFDGTAWTADRIANLTNLVGGEASERSEKTLSVLAPATDQQLGGVPSMESDAVTASIDRAREAQSGWAAMPPGDRAAIFDQFAALVEEHREELLDLIQLETGKARIHAAEELLDPVLTADYYAETAPGELAAERRAPAIPLITTAEVHFDPVGVVGVISPWNYPLSLSVVDAIPALVAGNAVVLKPDEKTPFTALRLAELLDDAGLPADVCLVVTGDGPVVGETLIEGVDYVTFTGSSETGRLVAAQAGRNLIDCSLELGGKNPMVVLADADVDMVARGATRACFTNAGQLCLSVERLYVHESIYDEFLDAFVEKTQALELGCDFGYESDVGSLIDSGQLDRVHKHVEDARDGGATVHCGGRKRTDVGPFFYEPTIMTDVPSNSLPACEETFGPVVSVTPVSSTTEAIERANETDYGLNASVWTSDLDRGREVALEIESGTVCLNDGYAVGYGAADAPMGGVGDSGVGRRHGPEGLKRFTEPKTIGTSRVGPIGDVPLVPDSLYARSTFTLLSALRRVKQKLR